MKRSLIIILHILSVLLFTAGLYVMHLYSTEGNGINWIHDQSFEDSSQFSEMVNADIRNLKRFAVLKNAFEEDGNVSNEKTVVLAATRSGNEEYSLGDIIEMAGRFGYTMDSDTHTILTGNANAGNANNYEVRVIYKAYDPYYFEHIEPGPSQGVMEIRELCLEVLRAYSEYHSLNGIYSTDLSNFSYVMNFESDQGDDFELRNTGKTPEELKRSGKYLVVTEEFDVETNISPQPANILTADGTYPLASIDGDLVNIGIDTAYIFADRYQAASRNFVKGIQTVYHWMAAMAVGAVLALASLVLVVRGTGKGELAAKETALDKMPYEAMVFLLGAVSIILYYLFKLSLYSVAEPMVPRTEWVFFRKLGKGLIIYGLCVIIFRSTFRRSQNNGILHNSLMLGIGQALTDRRSGSAAWNSFKSLGTIALINVLGGAGIIWLYAHRMEWGNYYVAFWLALILLAAVDAFAFVLVYRRNRQQMKLMEAVQRLSTGDAGYILPEEEYTGNELEMARNLNSISDGLQRSIHEQVKAERLKADLITNVSHDIRTPLTSIINYVDLIKREEVDNEKVREYIEVLDKKSARLKNLTEDLLEASKASSGNVRMDMQRLDMVELAAQAGGEFEDKFAARKLSLELSAKTDSAPVLADGRHLWRVFENLYNNAAKYAMEGTRVYADVRQENDKYIFTIKNVSQDKLNISPEELTERFVRGDISRSTEGSGLGLSIASSLTSLMGGELKIEIDGDLYKASVIMNAYVPPVEPAKPEAEAAGQKAKAPEAPVPADAGTVEISGEAGEAGEADGADTPAAEKL